MGGQEHGFQVPILLIIFRRPETTAIVFEAIRKVRPRQLFIAADGPRPDRPDDVTLRDESIEIVSKVDWPCEVKTWYKTENVGCGRNISSALDWFFSEVEEGIILEDDTVPAHSFFEFCREMLDRHRSNARIMHIGGVNFQDGIRRGDGDYYYSVYPFVWGWATWRRAWASFDFDIKSYPEFIKSKKLNHLTRNRHVHEYWTSFFDKYYQNPEARTAWSYQWIFAIFNQQGYTIIPNKNLVSNIGYGPNSTHTTHSDFMANNPVFELDFPLIHPKSMVISRDADMYFSKKIMKNLNRTWKDDVQDFQQKISLLNPKKNPFFIQLYQSIKPVLVRVGLKK